MNLHSSHVTSSSNEPPAPCAHILHHRPIPCRDLSHPLQLIELTPFPCAPGYLLAHHLYHTPIRPSPAICIMIVSPSLWTIVGTSRLKRRWQTPHPCYAHRCMNSFRRAPIRIARTQVSTPHVAAPCRRSAHLLAVHLHCTPDGLCTHFGSTQFCHGRRDHSFQTTVHGRF